MVLGFELEFVPVDDLSKHNCFLISCHNSNIKFNPGIIHMKGKMVNCDDLRIVFNCSVALRKMRRFSTSVIALV